MRIGLIDVRCSGFWCSTTGNQELNEVWSVCWPKRHFDETDAAWFEQIRLAGWIDVWRSRNPTKRQYTWYSTYNNGFRLDQVFATSEIEPTIKKVRYDWGDGGRDVSLSDHAAIVFELELK